MKEHDTPTTASSEDALPPVLTVEETARFLRIGRSAAYELVRTNSIPHVRLGKLIRIPRGALLAWLELQEPTTSGSSALKGV